MLEDILTRKKNVILGKWLELIADGYPAGLNLFKDKDRFTNPVGYTFSSELESLYDELLQQNPDSEKVCASLDSIVRIRAVQEFSPGQAVGFVFLLKKAIRDELAKDLKDNHALAELLEFECMIDDLACLTFDIFTKCREKIYELRMHQVKADRENAFRLMGKMLLKHEELEEVISSGYNNGSEGIG